MTIKIEREAVLYVLNGDLPSTSSVQAPASSSPPPSSSSSSDDDDAEIVVFCPKAEGPVSIPASSSPLCDTNGDDFFSSTPDLVESDVDSYADSSDLYSDSDSDDYDDDYCVSISERRVTFSPLLVTEVRTRPRTPPEDVRSLFYTYEETQAFREEYRRERELLSQLRVHDDYDDHSSAAPPAPPSIPPPPASPPTPPPSRRGGVEEDDAPSLPGGGSGPVGSPHRISRVVVRHRDTFETFYDDDDDDARLRVASPALPYPAVLGKSDDFFDSDSFWSGNITWY